MKRSRPGRGGAAPLLSQDETYALLDALGAASRRLLLISKPLTDQYLLGPRGFYILGAIGRGAQSPSELANMMMVSPSLVSVELQKLEEADLISRVINPQDGRRTHIELTGEGQAALSESINQYQQRTSAALLKYSPAKRAAFYAILNDIGAS